MAHVVTRLGCSLLLAVLAAPATAATATATATATADGIVATLQVNGSGVRVGWHFTRHPPAPVAGLVVTLNGRPLGVPEAPLAVFPGPGQSAALLFLADGGVAGSDKLAAEGSAALPRGVTARIARFGGAAPTEGAQPPWPGDLAAALDRGMVELGGTAADRRALVVCTDGFSRDALPVEALAAQAKAAGVALVFALARSVRLVDVAALARLAEATGGGTVPPGRPLPDALLGGALSGAEIRFPFGASRRYIWERRAAVVAQIDYGRTSLVLTTDADLPAAGLMDTATLLWARARRRLPAFAGGVAVALLGVAAVRRWPHATS